MSSKEPIPGRCGKKTRSGGFCEKWPIKGGKVCPTHGGSAKQVKDAAQKNLAKQEAEKAVAVYGLAREIEPHQALLEEIHRTAGAVAWLEEIIRDLEKANLTRGVAKAVQLPDGSRTIETRAAVNVWIQLYQDERDRLVRVAKAAIECGVAERAVKLAEKQAEQLAAVVGAIVTDLGHDLKDPAVRETVRLRLIEGGAE